MRNSYVVCHGFPLVRRRNRPCRASDHPELQSLSSSRQLLDGVYMMPPENAVVYASIKKGQFRTWIATKPSLSLQIGGCGAPQLRRGTTTSFYRASRRRRYRVFGAIEEAMNKAAFQIPVCCGSGRGDFSSRRAAGPPVHRSPLVRPGWFSTFAIRFGDTRPVASRCGLRLRTDHHVGQAKERVELMAVLRQSPIPHFAVPE